MKRISEYIRKVTYISCLLLAFSINAIAGDSIFKEIHRIPLQLDSLVFNEIVDLDPVKDGYILVLRRSAWGKADLIVKVNLRGELLSQYTKRGYGPGEIGNIGNVIVHDNRVYAIELTSPSIHCFDQHLKFVEDFRVKTGGKLIQLQEDIGVWQLATKNENDENKHYLVALYDSKTVDFKRYAFSVKEPPSYVHTWGGICRIDKDTYAGIYSNEYVIRVLNAQLERTKTIANVPANIKKRYYPVSNDPHTLTNTGVKWLKSWTKMKSIFYLNGMLVLTTSTGNDSEIDICTVGGNIIRSGCKMPKETILVESDGEYLLGLKWREPDNPDANTSYTILKLQLNEPVK